MFDLEEIPFIQVCLTTDLGFVLRLAGHKLEAYIARWEAKPNTCGSLHLRKTRSGVDIHWRKAINSGHRLVETDWCGLPVHRFGNAESVGNVRCAGEPMQFGRLLRLRLEGWVGEAGSTDADKSSGGESDRITQAKDEIN